MAGPVARRPSNRHGPERLSQARGGLAEPGRYVSSSHPEEHDSSVQKDIGTNCIIRVLKTKVKGVKKTLDFWLNL